MIGSSFCGSSANRLILSCAHVPIVVAVRYRTLFMSKTSSAPISDFFSSALALSSRSLRSRSKLMRFSQSTAIDPYVLIAIYDNPPSKKSRWQRPPAVHLLFEARHARQHLKHNREIPLRQAHAARRRQHFVRGGCHRQWNVHVTPQFHCQQH